MHGGHHPRNLKQLHKMSAFSEAIKRVAMVGQDAQAGGDLFA
jgi:hypothetical protein